MTRAIESGDFAVPAGPRRPLDRALREIFVGSSWNQVRRAIQTGKVSVEGVTISDARHMVAEGVVVRVALNVPRARRLLADDSIVHLDSAVVVVRKPAGMNTVPFEEGERGCLDQLVREIVGRRFGRQAPLGVVHRLDRETSGLLVFARTVPAKRHLKQQFREHSVTRRYFAIAAGHVETQTISSRLVKDRGDGVRGSTRNPKLGRAATTHVEVLESLSGATLIACRLETGRTHQIRIHLGEAGHPLLGERVYGPRDVERPPAPRVMLHAATLGFAHPRDDRPLLFEEPMPKDMLVVLDALRRP